jgi:restriction system protein
VAQRRTYRPAVRRRGRRPARRRFDAGIPLLLGLALAVTAVVGVVSWIARHLILTGCLALAVAAVAAVVLYGRAQRRARAVELQAVRARDVAVYLQMSPTEFERALAVLCERDGCTRVRVVGGAGDLGADVIATTPEGRRMVIQAKRYGPRTMVGSQDVQQVNGTYRDAHGAQLAAIVTTSGFTKPARSFGEQVGIRLYDRQALAGWASGTGPAPWR